MMWQGMRTCPPPFLFLVENIRLGGWKFVGHLLGKKGPHHHSGHNCSYLVRHDLVRHAMRNEALRYGGPNIGVRQMQGADHFF